MIVDGTNLSMIRGDTETLIAMQFLDEILVPIENGSTVYFTVKKSLDTEEKTLQKVVTTFTDGKAYINLSSADTKNIPAGRYKYDIQVTDPDGVVTTIIKPSTFVLLRGVTDE